MKPASQSAIASVPEPGAHLITPRRGYTHHGIYVGEGKVVHYAGLSLGLHVGPVEEISLDEFAGGHGWSAIDSPAWFGRAEIVRRARSRIGENRYRLVSNNCEHFCQWSRSGRAYSEQVERWMSCLNWLASLRAWVGTRTARPIALTAFIRTR